LGAKPTEKSKDQKTYFQCSTKKKGREKIKNRHRRPSPNHHPRTPNLPYLEGLPSLKPLSLFYSKQVFKPVLDYQKVVNGHSLGEVFTKPLRLETIMKPQEKHIPSRLLSSVLSLGFPHLGHFIFFQTAI
jgi:hypothetical protein